MAGIVEADMVIEDPDLRLDRVVEVVAVDERVEKRLPDRRKRVVPDLSPPERLLHRLFRDVVPDAEILLDDPLTLLSGR